jgi:Protein of unknown function (DUF1364)
MSKLRDAARGQNCEIRVPGICRHDSDTVVLCHYRLSGLNGMGIKPLDICGAYGCHDCHAAVDGRLTTGFSRDELRLMHAEGVMRTLTLAHKRGLL